VVIFCRGCVVPAMAVNYRKEPAVHFPFVSIMPHSGSHNVGQFHESARGAPRRGWNRGMHASSPSGS
jgi:hypothetical protein